METSAASILTRAVELEKLGRYTEASVTYQEGVQLLLDAIKVTSVEAKKQKLREAAMQYLDHAEKIKKLVEQQKEAGKYHEQIRIESNSTGHSYEEVFGRFLDKDVTVVTIEDPYIRSVHQIVNLLRFCELLVRSCSSLKSISLLTTAESNSKDHDRQQSQLEQIQKSISQHNVTLTIEYSQTLHDREIRFDSGWIVKIGRGLDYFKPTEGKFCIGYYDMDLRPCHETTVDVFHKNHLKT